MGRGVGGEGEGRGEEGEKRGRKEEKADKERGRGRWEEQKWGGKTVVVFRINRSVMYS